MTEPSVSPTYSVDAVSSFPATPPKTLSTVALPTNVLRADQLFFDGLTAMAAVPFLLIVLCKMHRAWRSHLYHRQIQILEKLWLLPISQSPPFK